eukprot:Lithocolla_globosa_v1_NODE_1257_length_2727_cov_5.577470.p1 type:complete len:892 gc:universal NODE_1257_length_2727_cov_5.577470:2684-9(-)
MSEKRLGLIFELLSTERNYINQLEVLISLFLEPLKSHPSKLVTAQQITGIFSNVFELVDLNFKFLEALESRVQNSDWGQQGYCIGDVFLNFVPKLNIYSVYIANFAFASKLVDELKKNKEVGKEFSQFIVKQQKDPQCKRLELPAILVAPVQRIPRYLLFLRDLIKKTETDHVDYPLLAESLQVVERVAEYLNNFEGSLQKILELESRLSGIHGTIVSASRALVREDVFLTLESESRTFWLFNDLLLAADRKGGRVEAQVKLEMVRSVQPVEKIPEGIRITMLSGDQVVLIANTTKDQEEWMTDLNKYITETKANTEVRDDDLIGAAKFWSSDEEGVFAVELALSVKFSPGKTQVFLPAVIDACLSHLNALPRALSQTRLYISPNNFNSKVNYLKYVFEQGGFHDFNSLQATPEQVGQLLLVFLKELPDHILGTKDSTSVWYPHRTDIDNSSDDESFVNSKATSSKDKKKKMKKSSSTGSLSNRLNSRLSESSNASDDSQKDTKRSKMRRLLLSNKDGKDSKKKKRLTFLGIRNHSTSLDITLSSGDLPVDEADAYWGHRVHAGILELPVCNYVLLRNLMAHLIKHLEHAPHLAGQRLLLNQLTKIFSQVLRITPELFKHLLLCSPKLFKGNYVGGKLQNRSFRKSFHPLDYKSGSLPPIRETSNGQMRPERPEPRSQTEAVFGVSLEQAISFSQINPHIPLPNVLHLCLSYLNTSEKAMANDDLYTQTKVITGRMKFLRSLMDEGQIVDFPSSGCSYFEVANFLPQYLDELPEEVIGDHVFDDLSKIFKMENEHFVVDSEISDETAKEIADLLKRELETFQLTCLAEIMLHLQYYVGQNKSRVDTVTQVFCETGLLPRNFFPLFLHSANRLFPNQLLLSLNKVGGGKSFY